MSSDCTGIEAYYDEEEKEMIRTQLREANRLALEAAMRHGVKVNPRVAAIKAAARQTS